MARWLPWLLASLFYAYINILRNLPVVTEHELKNIFQLSDICFGQVRGLYYIGYTAIHLPMAYLLDRFSVKYITPLAIILCVAGIAPMVLSTNPLVLIIGRVVLGIGSSAAILSVFKVIRDVYPENYFARMLGLAASIGLMAAFFGFGPLNQLFEKFGYATSLYTLGIAGIVLAALSFLFFEKKTSEVNENFFQEIIELIKDKKFLIVCLLGGLLIGSIEGFADGWSAQFLLSNYAISKAEAAYTAGVIMLGFALGSPFLSYIADRFDAHVKIKGYCGLLSALSFCALILFKVNYPDALWIPKLLYFVLGATVSFQIMTIFLAGKAVPKHLVGISGGGCNMIIMSFGWIYHSLIGIIMDQTKICRATDICTYPLSSYAYMFMLIGIPALFVYIMLNWVKVDVSFSANAEHPENHNIVLDPRNKLEDNR